MAKAIFLTNPNLNNDDVTVTASSELGQRAGQPKAYSDNSGELTVTTIGDAGDDLDHDFIIRGGQKRPQYSPLNSTDQVLYTAPETYATLAGSIACGSTAQVALAAADDRLYVVVADSGQLTIYSWNGAGWTSRATTSGVGSSAGGIAAAGVDESVYVAIANNTDTKIDLWKFNTDANTFSLFAESMVATDGTVSAVALGIDGLMCSLLVTRVEGGGHDVDVYFGSISAPELREDTLADQFGATWSSGGEVRCCGISHNATYGFVAAVRSSTSDLKVIFSPDGDRWRQFRDINNVIDQPTTSSGWGSASNSAVALENRRAYIIRAGGSSVILQYFNGVSTWSAEVDIDGGVAFDSGSPICAAEWRGAIYVAWRSSSSAITVRRGNQLTTTNTGYYREIRLGEQMFLAGLDDDTRTALFFVASGGITAGDGFRVPASEFDYRVEHVLDDFLMKVWRGEHDDEQVIQFDAGSGRAFVIDAIAIRSNLPSITVRIDDDAAFGSPSTTQAITATVQTATPTSVDRNKVGFADDTFKPRQYAPGRARYWITLSNGVFRIVDNTHNTLILDDTAAGASLAASTIFRDSMGYIFSSTQAAGRYLRLTTPTVELPDGYYEVKRVIFGLKLALARNFSNGFQRVPAAVEATTALKSGARFMTKLNNEQREGFVLPWQVLKLDPQMTPLRGLYGLSEGARQLIAFWPFPTPFPGADGDIDGDQPEMYLGRIVEPLTHQHIQQFYYSVGGMKFETEVG